MQRSGRWQTTFTKYHNVSINYNALATLPEDGDLSGMCTMTLEPSEDEQEVSAPTMPILQEHSSSLLLRG